MMPVAASSVHCAAESLFFFNDTATTEIYPLSLHDALPILSTSLIATWSAIVTVVGAGVPVLPSVTATGSVTVMISAEHTSELQTLMHLGCRLLPENTLKANLAITVSRTAR